MPEAHHHEAPILATSRRRKGARAVLILSLTFLGGCGTTRVTDTQRSATEQLLVSNSIDQAVSQLDFRPLAEKKVFFDAQHLDGVVDRAYLISSLRQHMLASGCVLEEDRSKANVVIEVRAGGVGTDRNDLLLGLPQLTVPSLLPGQPGATIPEIPVAKKTDKKGVAKIAVFAYNRTTGRPIWQSGVRQAMSSAKDYWLLGAGPFRFGTIVEGTEFAGQQIQIPLVDKKDSKPETSPFVTTKEPSPVPPVTQAAFWPERASPSPNDYPAVPASASGEKATAPDDCEPPPASAPSAQPKAPGEL
jgi:hypothetical protein